jgi:RNA polymerase sigma-70 factor (ECF subfamily)
MKKVRRKLPAHFLISLRQQPSGEDVMKIQPLAKKDREAEIVHRSMRGDAEALEILFSHYGRALYPAALKVLGNPEDAEDALQEGLLAAFRNLRRFEGRSQFSTWLTRIVINASLMRLRNLRVRPLASLDDSPAGQPELSFGDLLADPGLNPEEAYGQEEMAQIFKEGLDTLPDKFRSPMLLRDVEELSTEEAAQALEISEGTLKSRLHRARVSLANAVRRRLAPARRQRTAASNGLAGEVA